MDPAHSSAKFTVTHLVISKVEGNFKTFSGTLINTKPDFTDAKVDFTIDVNSVNTDNQMYDKHLKGNDFLIPRNTQTWFSKVLPCKNLPVINMLLWEI